MTPSNPVLYNMAKEIIYKRYKKPSAYRSGALQKEYKKLGGTYIDDNKDKPLKRWFKEQWGDYAGLEYPVYRPSIKVSKETPLTIQEIEPDNLLTQAVEKQKIKGSKNLKPFIKK
jgi:hypothetical protein